MKVKVIKAFMGKPDNEMVSRLIAVGEIIEGELAEVAIANKLAVSEADKPAARPVLKLKSIK